jgi:hypothetical protein
VRKTQMTKTPRKERETANKTKIITKEKKQKKMMMKVI